MWTFEERNDPEALLAYVVRYMERHGLPWTREVIAKARGGADLEPIVTKILALRVQGLHYADRYRSAHDPRLEALLPLREVLAHYFVMPSGAMFGQRIEAIERHPLALLGLDSEWYVHAGLDRHTPIRQAQRWAEANPRHKGRQVYVDALEVFRSEQRWLATFDNEDLDNPLAKKRLDYDTIVHGLWEIFDPLVLETPLGALNLKSGVSARLVRGLKKATLFESDGETLGGLPLRSGHLVSLDGLGRASVDVIKVALVGVARQWRSRRFGADEARMGQAERDAGDELKGGLDDLVAMFGES